MEKKVEIDYTMLEYLRKKLTWVLITQAKTKTDMSAALSEVNRQIDQVLKGEPVTKSDGADENDW